MSDGKSKDTSKKAKTPKQGAPPAASSPPAAAETKKKVEATPAPAPAATAPAPAATSPPTTAPATTASAATTGAAPTRGGRGGGRGGRGGRGRGGRAAPTNGAAEKKDEKKEGKGTDRDEDGGNQVWISATKRLSFYGAIALRMFVNHQQVELHGLGAAISSTVEVAQHLINTKRATLTKITTATNVETRKPQISFILTRTGIPDIATIKQHEDTADGEEEEDS